MTAAVDDGPRDWARARLALPVCSMAAAAVVLVVVVRAAESYEWLVLRLEVVAIFLLAIGIALRSERSVALATAPAMAGLVAGVVSSEGIAWAAALVAGCVWYVAAEAALASIEWGGSLRISTAVIQRRVLEVAVVVASGAAVGLSGLTIALVAPERSLLVRVVVLAAVVIGLLGALRHLLATNPATDDERA